MAYHGWNTSCREWRETNFYFMLSIRKLIGLSFVLFFALPAIAQDYQSAVGLRIGSTAGITVKHFVSPTTSFEGQLESIWQGVNVSGLLEFYQSAFDVPGFRFFGGFGAHFGSWKGYANHPWFYEDRNYHSVIGVDAILGFEYTFKEIPLNLGLDWKPGFNITDAPGPWIDNLGLSIRFAIQ